MPLPDLTGHVAITSDTSGFDDVARKAGSADAALKQGQTSAQQYSDSLETLSQNMSKVAGTSEEQFSQLRTTLQGVQGLLADTTGASAGIDFDAGALQAVKEYVSALTEADEVTAGYAGQLESLPLEKQQSALEHMADAQKRVSVEAANLKDHLIGLRESLSTEIEPIELGGDQAGASGIEYTTEKLREMTTVSSGARDSIADLDATITNTSQNAAEMLRLSVENQQIQRRSVFEAAGLLDAGSLPVEALDRLSLGVEGAAESILKLKAVAQASGLDVAGSEIENLVGSLEKFDSTSQRVIGGNLDLYKLMATQIADIKFDESIQRFRGGEGQLVSRADVADQFAAISETNVKASELGDILGGGDFTAAKRAMDVNTESFKEFSGVVEENINITDDWVRTTRDSIDALGKAGKGRQGAFMMAGGRTISKERVDNLKELTNLLENYSSKSKEILTDTSLSADEITKRLETNARTTRIIADEVFNVSDRTNATIGSVLDSADEVASAAEKVGAGFRASEVPQTTEDIEDLASSLGTLPDAAGRAATGLGQAGQEISDGISTATDNIDVTGLGDKVNEALAGSAKDLTKGTAAIGDAISTGLSDAWAQAIEATGSLPESEGGTLVDEVYESLIGETGATRSTETLQRAIELVNRSGGDASTVAKIWRDDFANIRAETDRLNESQETLNRTLKETAQIDPSSSGRDRATVSKEISAAMDEQAAAQDRFAKSSARMQDAFAQGFGGQQGQATGGGVTELEMEDLNTEMIIAQDEAAKTKDKITSLREELGAMGQEGTSAADSLSQSLLDIDDGRGFGNIRNEAGELLSVIEQVEQAGNKYDNTMEAIEEAGVTGFQKIQAEQRASNELFLETEAIQRRQLDAQAQAIAAATPTAEERTSVLPWEASQNEKFVEEAKNLAQAQEEAAAAATGLAKEQGGVNAALSQGARFAAINKEATEGLIAQQNAAAAARKATWTETEQLVASELKFTNAIRQHGETGSVVSEKFYDSWRRAIQAREELMSGGQALTGALPEDAFDTQDIDLQGLKVFTQEWKDYVTTLQGVQPILEVITEQTRLWKEEGLEIPRTFQNSLEKLQETQDILAQTTEDKLIKRNAVSDLLAGNIDPEMALTRMASRLGKEVPAVKRQKRTGVIIQEAVAQFKTGDVEDPAAFVDTVINKLADIPKKTERLVEDFQKITKKFAPDATEGADAFDKLGKSIRSVNSPLGMFTRLLVPRRLRFVASLMLGVGGALGAVGIAAGVAVVGFTKFLKLMEGVEARKDEMEKLNAKFGDTAELIDEIDVALDGLGTEPQIIQVLFEVDKQGVLASGDSLDEIAEIAAAKAAKMGTSWQKVMADIVNAIEAGNGSMLESSFLIDNANVALLQYSREVGVAVSELTEWQVQQALLNAVLEKGADAVQKPLTVLQEYRNAQTKLASSLDESKRAFLEFFAATIDPESGSFIEWYTGVLQGLTDTLNEQADAWNRNAEARRAATSTGDDELGKFIVLAAANVEEANIKAEEAQRKVDKPSLGDMLFGDPEQLKKDAVATREAADEYKEVVDEMIRQASETGTIDPALGEAFKETGIRAGVFTEKTFDPGIFGTFGGFQEKLDERDTGSERRVQAIDNRRRATEDLAAAQEALDAVFEKGETGKLAEGELERAENLHRQAQATFDLADAEGVLKIARVDYEDSLRSGSDIEKEAAVIRYDAAIATRDNADYYEKAVSAIADLEEAEANLTSASSTMTAVDREAAQAKFEHAEAMVSLRIQAFELASGQNFLTGETIEAGDAADEFSSISAAWAKVMGDASDTVGVLISDIDGMPIALDIANYSMDEAGNVSKRLVADLADLAIAYQQAGLAASSQAFAQGLSYAPLIGGQASIEKAIEQRETSQDLTAFFVAESEARLERTGQPLPVSFLEEAQAGLQKGFGEDQRQLIRSMNEMGKAVETVAEKIEKAMDKMIAALLKPTTSGLTGEGGENLVDKWLGAGASGEEDFADNPARRILAVLDKGEDSEWFEYVKSLFPTEAAEKPLDEFFKFLAQKIDDHNKGLSFELYDKDFIADSIIGDIKGAKAKAAAIEEQRAFVLERGKEEGITDQDLEDYYQTDTDRMVGAINAAAKTSAEQLQIGMETIAAAGRGDFDLGEGEEVIEGKEGEDENLIVRAYQLDEDQKQVLRDEGVTASEVVGESMNSQMIFGNYGVKAVQVIQGQLTSEASSTKMAESGKTLAGWLGTNMTDEFSKTVPPVLLDILTDKLVPLILAALNTKDDGTGGKDPNNSREGPK